MAWNLMMNYLTTVRSKKATPKFIIKSFFCLQIKPTIPVWLDPSIISDGSAIISPLLIASILFASESFSPEEFESAQILLGMKKMRRIQRKARIATLPVEKIFFRLKSLNVLLTKD